MAGLALKSLGHNTTILERNPTPLLHNQGAGVVAGGDMLAFFNKYDRCKRPIAVASQKRMYLDKSGKVVHEENMEQNMTSWDLVYYMLRANFDGVESGYCNVPEKQKGDGVARYEYGHNITGLEEGEGESVRVLFRKQDGTEGSMAADLVVGADGPSSTVRKIFHPEVQRKLVGYCALRGTVPEDEASVSAKEAFQEQFTFFHADGIQILAYLIPGTNGSIKPGERLINFVWYYNFPEDSPEFEELLTDVEGVRHRITLPPGKMQPSVWDKQIEVARTRMPPQFAEIIAKTKHPFVQAITDVISPENSFMNGNVLLIGDALAGFRPHPAASTSQAAYDTMALADLVSGKITHDHFVEKTMQFARFVQDRGVKMGTRSQFGTDVPLKAHIADRNLASTPRQEEVYPEWTKVKRPNSEKVDG
jgi:2-polyprenyl-6-methoxyphenol hydroxylase-like FAD-dependent oxidoreductase